MLTGVVQDPNSIFARMYWSFETDSDLGKNMEQWKSSYEEAEFNKPFPLGRATSGLNLGLSFIGSPPVRVSILTSALVITLTQRWVPFYAIAIIIKITTARRYRVTGMTLRNIALIFI